MNERIEELAGQAFQFSADNADENGKGQLGVFAEKFAELIVDECMLINRQRLFPDYEGDSHRVAHNNALLCANSDLREHFGVEL